MSTDGGLTPPGWQAPGHQGSSGTPGAPGPVLPAPPPPLTTAPTPAYPAYAGVGPRALDPYRPGVVPLRPLALGDIYDGAIRAIRANPRATLGLAIVVNALFLLPSALLGLAVSSGLGESGSPVAAQLGALPALLLPPLFSQLAVVVLGGLLAYVVSEAVLGHKAGLRQAWRAVRGRLLALLGLTLLLGLAVLVPVIALAALAVWAGVQQSWAAMVLAIVATVLAALALSLTASVLSALAGPAVVLERQGVLAGLRRARALARSGFWRLLGILLLTSLLGGVAAYLLHLPFSLLGALGGVTFAPATSSGALWLPVLTSTCGYLLSNSLVTPFVSAVGCLLYVDRRIRTEALDVVLLRAAAQEHAGEHLGEHAGAAPGPDFRAW